MWYVFLNPNMHQASAPAWATWTLAPCGAQGSGRLGPISTFKKPRMMVKKKNGGTPLPPLAGCLPTSKPNCSARPSKLQGCKLSTRHWIGQRLANCCSTWKRHCPGNSSCHQATSDGRVQTIHGLQQLLLCFHHCSSTKRRSRATTTLNNTRRTQRSTAQGHV